MSTHLRPRTARTGAGAQGRAALGSGPSAVVELVGPAGAGKTTLLGALAQACGAVVPGLRVGRVAQVPHHLRHLGVLLPALLGRKPASRRPSLGEMRSMAYLPAWRRALARRSPGQLVVLDHGPIFRLAMLQEFGPELVRGAAFQRWWSDELHKWAALIDLVVCLDAPDAVLIDRVLEREVGHRIKHQSRQEAKLFLARYRDSFQRVMHALGEAGGVDLLRFDTSQRSQDEIVSDVLRTVQAGSG